MISNTTFVLIFGIILMLNYSDGAHLMNFSGTQRACGRELADLLHFVCQGRTNKIRTKRAEFIVMDDYNSNDNENILDDEYDLQSQLSDNTFLTKFGAVGTNAGLLYPRIRRSWLGVSDECCKKTCSLQILKSYCF